MDPIHEMADWEDDVRMLLEYSAWNMPNVLSNPHVLTLRKKEPSTCSQARVPPFGGGGMPGGGPGFGACFSASEASRFFSLPIGVLVPLDAAVAFVGGSAAWAEAMMLLWTVLYP